MSLNKSESNEFKHYLHADRVLLAANVDYERDR